MSSAVREKVEAYFASINPTSKRMMEDLNFAKQQHGDKWDILSPQEQEEVLWKAVVHPEIENKFEKPPEILDVECFPVLRLKPGSKVVIDEDVSAGKPFGSTWRDEHSAPFRWETQSQLNLTFCEKEAKKEKDKEIVKAVSESTPDISVDEKKDDDLKRHLTIKRPEVPPPPVPPHATPPATIRSKTLPPVVPRHTEKSDTPIYAKVVKRKASAKTLVISEMKAHKKALAEMKPAVPPRMSLELKVDINDPKYRSLDSTDSDAIPKTGFDFLDNW